ncbi:hypothetical protein [Streptomyces montanus]|uniref:hypothetical protein n=1 Tax=Streptomyces montanus TaxID=2580423 RepID=UPI001FEB8A51|nr:hypothetical protein [Streptomyces montanus]
MHTPLTEPPAGAGAESLEHQKAAITRLGHELRALVEATVRTAASPDTLHRVADGVRHVTGQLTGRRRTRAEIPEVDGFPGGRGCTALSSGRAARWPRPCTSRPPTTA